MNAFLNNEALGIDCGEIPSDELSQEISPVSVFLNMKMDASGLNINTDYPASAGNFTKCTTKRKILYIVIHYVGTNGTGYSVAKYWKTAGRESSAHFVVGLAKENGQIYQMVDPANKAWHCGTTGKYYHPECRNANSIGIETACHNDTSDLTASSIGWYFDAVTVDKLVQLTRYLMEKYGIDADHVVRHYDVTHKTCPAMWVHDEAAWAAFKARLDDDPEALVNLVAGKIGLLSADFWTLVLNGSTTPKAQHVKALLEKVCAAKGKAYSYAAADSVLSLGADDYWMAVLSGTQTANAATILALFKRINAEL